MGSLDKCGTMGEVWSDGWEKIGPTGEVWSDGRSLLRWEKFGTLGEECGIKGKLWYVGLPRSGICL